MTTASRFWLVTVGSAVACLVLWGGLDFVLVRNAPSNIHDYDLLTPLFPLAVAITAFTMLPDATKTRRVALAALSAVCASVMATALVVTIGIWFHFSIGGWL